MLEQQIQVRRGEADSLATGLDHMIAKEVTRGEIAGIMLAIRYPEMLLRDLDDRLGELTKNDEVTE